MSGTLDPRIQPVEKYLGRAAAQGGPFALLGLTPDDCTQELIIVQLQRQLARLAANPDAATHEADEVRLALHAAAAKLLEGAPSLRTPEVSAAMAGSGITTTQLAIERAIVATLAQFGGWNSRSLHRLTLIAHSQGISHAELVQAVQSFSRAPTSGATWAPAYVTYGWNNRTMMLRIPDRGRIEDRFLPQHLVVSCQQNLQVGRLGGFCSLDGCQIRRAQAGQA